VSREPHNQKLSPLEAAERHRQFVLVILRFGFLVLFGTVALLSILSVTTSSAPGDISRAMDWGRYLILAAALGALVVLVDVYTPQKKVGTLFVVFTGLLAAMLATVAVGAVIDLLSKIYGFESEEGLISTAKVLTGVGLAYLCISTVLQTQDDFRLVIPYVEFAKQLRGPRPMLLDTSSIIDARIADLAQTGMLQNPIVIPEFVIVELQTLADSQDKLKRARGRRGLDVVTRLQRMPGLDVSIDETPVAAKGVDMMLVELARQMQGVIVTADVALNRVAGIHNVQILNLNDVANSLKPALIPGQQIRIHLLKAGEQPGQGVGYLDDGTMVVAEDGGPYVGEQVSLMVTSSLQTSAGRLIFGRLIEERAGEAPAEAASSFPAQVGAAPAPTAEGGPRKISIPVGAEQDAEPAVSTAAGPRGPFPPKPPNKRVNPFRNPRR
jgi:uncharacterized protein YacL